VFVEDPLGCFVPVHSGHLDVHEDQVDLRVSADGLDGAGPAVHRLHLVAGPAQHRNEHLLVDGTVLGDQDLQPGIADLERWVQLPGFVGTGHREVGVGVVEEGVERGGGDRFRERRVPSLGGRLGEGPQADDRGRLGELVSEIREEESASSVDEQLVDDEDARIRRVEDVPNLGRVPGDEVGNPPGLEQGLDAVDLEAVVAGDEKRVAVRRGFPRAHGRGFHREAERRSLSRCALARHVAAHQPGQFLDDGEA